MLRTTCSARHFSTTRAWAVLLALASLATLAACGKGEATKAGSPTQVAARVNNQEISIHQVEHLVQRQPPQHGEQGAALAKRILDNLIEQEIAAQAARKDGLDQDPRVVQAMEVAKREVLARAYQEKMAENVAQPSSDEVDRYYDSQPALFAKRKTYALQEFVIAGTAEHIAAVTPKVEAATSVAQVVDALSKGGFKFTSRQLTSTAEEVPLALLGPLSELRDGQSIVTPNPSGARVVTVLKSEQAPINRQLANRPIHTYMVNDRKRQIVREGMKALRGAAVIEYYGKFAQASAEPASATATAQVKP